MADKRPRRQSEAVARQKALSRWEGEGGAVAEHVKPKRPRDLNQWAKRMVDMATTEDRDAKPDKAKRSTSVKPRSVKEGTAVARLVRRKDQESP